MRKLGYVYSCHLLGYPIGVWGDVNSEAISAFYVAGKVGSTSQRTASREDAGVLMQAVGSEPGVHRTGGVGLQGAWWRIDSVE